MIRLGLTGSIGMGKSTTAGLFAEAGAPVYNADSAVHELYKPGGAAVGPVSLAFPSSLSPEGGIDRAKLRLAVLGDGEAIARLEAIVHPLVAQSQLAFLETARDGGAPFVVLDIPLLFETGGERRCDYVLVVTAPEAMQKQRVLERGEMDEAAFQAVLARQVPDAEKRARADFVLNTGFGLEFAREVVRAISGLMIRLAGEPRA